MIGWVVGLASNLPAWAYLPLALVIIGAALWIINQLAQIRGRQKKEVSHKIHSAKGEVYEDEVIILAELLGESHHTIEECVFRSCLIKGPVLIVLEGNVQFQGKGDVLADSVEDILYEVDEGRKLSGAIKV